MKNVCFAHRYQLEACLGRGQSTVAYRGKGLSTNQPYLVLLICLPSGLSAQISSCFLQRFHRIVKKLQLLPAHPSLLCMSDAGVWRGIPYLVFPESVVPSLSLPLPPQQAVVLIRDVAHGLEHAHTHGMVHGNITLSSLLHSPSGNVRIAGLGLRALLEAAELGLEMPYAHIRTVWGTFLGDPLALAPECLLGARPDQQSDIYALGVLLYQLLVRHRDTDGNQRDYLHVATGVLYRSLPSLSHLPRQIVSLLSRLMALQVEERFDSMKSVIYACRACLESIESI